jgi:uncharacterized protein YjiS (DUF1127 family)
MLPQEVLILMTLNLLSKLNHQKTLKHTFTDLAELQELESQEPALHFTQKRLMNLFKKLKKWLESN